MSETVEKQEEIEVETKASISYKRKTKLVAMDAYVWERLKLDISNMDTENNWFHDIAFALFGFAGSALITLVSLWESENCDGIKTWLKIAIVCPIVIGALCLYFNYALKKNNSKFAESVQKTIGKIEETNK